MTSLWWAPKVAAHVGCVLACLLSLLLLLFFFGTKRFRGFLQFSNFWGPTSTSHVSPKLLERGILTGCIFWKVAPQSKRRQSKDRAQPKHTVCKRCGALAKFVGVSYKELKALERCLVPPRLITLSIYLHAVSWDCLAKAPLPEM